MEKPIILPDTSLCAIVRDEIMNPAGGIADFAESTVPFMEEAVIVDTGSVDGTRQALEELSGKYKNLRVYDHKFNGYALSRNVSLSHIKTKRAFVLDADERLTKEGFEILKNEIEEFDVDKYNFRFLFVYEDSETISNSVHNPRLFEMRIKPVYTGKWCESMQMEEDYKQSLHLSRTEILHFLSSLEAHEYKTEEWYGMLFSSMDNKPYIHTSLVPSRMKHFSDWKRFNPRRNDYR
jgi:glycosyltransferase involved in cell wall biosynthesis